MYYVINPVLSSLILGRWPLGVRGFQPIVRLKHPQSGMHPSSLIPEHHPSRFTILEHFKLSKTRMNPQFCDAANSLIIEK